MEMLLLLLLLLLLLGRRCRSRRLLTAVAAAAAAVVVVVFAADVSPLPELAVSVACFGRSCYRRRRWRRVRRLPRRGRREEARLCLRLWSMGRGGFEASEKVRGRRATTFQLAWFSRMGWRLHDNPPSLKLPHFSAATGSQSSALGRAIGAKQVGMLPQLSLYDCG